jgi:hypothetical protein
VWLLRPLLIMRDVWKQIVALDWTETSIGPLSSETAAIFVASNCYRSSSLTLPPLLNGILDELPDLRIRDLLRRRKGL